MIYGLVMGIFIITINILKYNNNFKNLSYDSSFVEVVAYVFTAFMGNGYIGIYPISKVGKMMIILLSYLKYLILIEIVIRSGTPQKYLNIYNGVKDIINSEMLQLKT
jgi:hypothetical protein